VYITEKQGKNERKKINIGIKLQGRLDVLEEDISGNHNNNLQYNFDTKIIQKDTNVVSKEE